VAFFCTARVEDLHIIIDIAWLTIHRSFHIEYCGIDLANKEEVGVVVKNLWRSSDMTPLIGSQP